jgi:PiT family inorganic phosphate transporter
VGVEHLLLVIVILLALLFTFTNGFQDGSSVCAAAITSRAMTPFQAIAFVSLCELAGAMFGGSAVAISMQQITTHPMDVSLLPVLISALIAAISWNFLTRRFGLPSSSTHALVGGIIGALYGEGGAATINWGHATSLWQATGVAKVVLALFLSPVIGFLAGFAVLVILTGFLTRMTLHASKFLKWLQWLATGLLAFGHGSNDPQKSMGVIMLAVHSVYTTSSPTIPLSVRFATGLVIGIGIVALAPNIVKRVGAKIYKLRNLHALSAETASAIVLVGGSLTGGPVSASQVISSSVIGVGSAVRPKRLHWLVVRDMLVAWCLTIPCSAMLALGLHLLVLQWVEKAVHGIH